MTGSIVFILYNIDLVTMHIIYYTYEEMLIDVFVNKYYAACELALFCPLQKINFHDVIDDSYEDEMEDDNSIIT